MRNCSLHQKSLCHPYVRETQHWLNSDFIPRNDKIFEFQKNHLILQDMEFWIENFYFDGVGPYLVQWVNTGMIKNLILTVTFIFLIPGTRCALNVIRGESMGERVVMTSHFLVNISFFVSQNFPNILNLWPKDLVTLCSIGCILPILIPKWLFFLDLTLRSLSEISSRKLRLI